MTDGALLATLTSAKSVAASAEAVVAEPIAPPAPVGSLTTPAEATPRDGVAWHVACIERAKLFKPSKCSGSDGPGGRVPTKPLKLQTQLLMISLGVSPLSTV